MNFPCCVALHRDANVAFNIEHLGLPLCDAKFRELYDSRSFIIKRQCCDLIRKDIAIDNELPLRSVVISCVKETIPTLIGSVSVDPPMTMSFDTQADHIEAAIRSVQSNLFSVAGQSPNTSLSVLCEQTNTGAECELITNFMELHRNDSVCVRH